MDSKPIFQGMEKSFFKDSHKWLWCILLVGFALRAGWINYSLPDPERISLHFSGRMPTAVGPERLNVTRVLNSSYPDEADVIGGISNMNPRALQFNPQVHYWGHFHFYSIAAVYAFGMVTKIIPTISTKYYFFDHPQAMDRLYLLGRGLSILMGTLSIALLFFITARVYGDGPGLLAASVLALMPIHIFLSSLMAFDVPMIFWALLTLNALILYRTTQKKMWYWLTFFFFGITVGAKLHGMLLVFAFLLSAFEERRGQRLKFLAKGLVFSVIIFAVTNPYYFLDLKGVLEQNLGGSVMAREAHTLTGLQMFKNTLHNLCLRSPQKFSQSFGWLSSVIVGIFFIIGSFRDRRWGVFFLAVALPVFILDAFLRASVLRYFLLTTVFVLPTFAYGLWHCPLKIRAALFSILLSCLLAIDVLLLVGAHRPYSDHVAGHWIQQNIAKGASIGTYHKMYYSPPVDWDDHVVLSLVHARGQGLHPDFIIWPNIKEFDWIFGEMGNAYQDFGLIGVVGENKVLNFLLAPYDKRLGEYHHVQPSYHVFAKVTP